MPRKAREVSYLEIRNWAKYQHYKDRRPPWVKLHGEILDDYEWIASDYRSRLLAVCLLIVSGRLDNHIPNDSQWLAGQCAMRTADVKAGIERLLAISFLQAVPGPAGASEPASDPLPPVLANVLADSPTVASPHVRPPARGETEAETEKKEQGAKAPLSATAPTDVEQRVYDVWRNHFGKTDKRYDTISPKRLKAIRKALKFATSGELILCLDGLAYESPQWWIQHNEPWVVWRDQERIEHLLELEERRPAAVATTNGRRAGMTPLEIVEYTAQMKERTG